MTEGRIEEGETETEGRQIYSMETKGTNRFGICRKKKRGETKKERILKSSKEHKKE